MTAARNAELARTLRAAAGPRATFGKVPVSTLAEAAAALDRAAKDAELIERFDAGRRTTVCVWPYGEERNAGYRTLYLPDDAVVRFWLDPDWRKHRRYLDVRHVRARAQHPGTGIEIMADGGPLSVVPIVSNVVCIDRPAR